MAGSLDPWPFLPAGRGATPLWPSAALADCFAVGPPAHLRVAQPQQVLPGSPGSAPVREPHERVAHGRGPERVVPDADEVEVRPARGD
eukprot:10748614-Lingulodinium_polyedra.AAC.1